jgi:hypothetical protein
MKCFDHLVLGCGMTALGVIQALRESKKSINWGIISPLKDCKKILYEINNKRRLAPYASGFGGASSKWHGVISYPFNWEIAKELEFHQSFQKLLTRFYPRFTAFEKIVSGYSYIPFRPIRPLMRVSESVIDDYIVKVEHEADIVVLHGVSRKYRTRKLWICAGPEETFRLLVQSGLASQECTMDEHMVGYMAQANRSQISLLENEPSVIYTNSGHLKRHYKIGSDRQLYLTLRPAVSKFEDLRYAQAYRGFFSDSSISIVKKLMTKFNVGLFSEAMYNKFGIEFPARKYNLVGHVDLPGAVTMFLDIDKVVVKYNISSIRFSDCETRSIDQHFGFKLEYPEEVYLSPGIHFMNPRWLVNDMIDMDATDYKSTKSISVLGGMGLLQKSVEHPTFGFMVASYMKSKTLIQQ